MARMSDLGHQSDPVSVPDRSFLGDSVFDERLV